jgi:hypothetical protein
MYPLKQNHGHTFNPINHGSDNNQRHHQNRLKSVFNLPAVFLPRPVLLSLLLVKPGILNSNLLMFLIL